MDERPLEMPPEWVATIRRVAALEVKAAFGAFSSSNAAARSAGVALADTPPPPAAKDGELSAAGQMIVDLRARVAELEKELDYDETGERWASRVADEAERRRHAERQQRRAEAKVWAAKHALEIERSRPERQALAREMAALRDERDAAKREAELADAANKRLDAEIVELKAVAQRLNPRAFEPVVRTGAGPSAVIPLRKAADAEREAQACRAAQVLAEEQLKLSREDHAALLEDFQRVQVEAAMAQQRFVEAQARAAERAAKAERWRSRALDVEAMIAKRTGARIGELMGPEWVKAHKDGEEG